LNVCAIDTRAETTRSEPGPDSRLPAVARSAKAGVPTTTREQ
jgi:hypothetical protein